MSYKINLWIQLQELNFTTYLLLPVFLCKNYSDVQSKKLPQYGESSFSEKDKVLRTKREIRYRKVLLSLSI